MQVLRALQCASSRADMTMSKTLLLLLGACALVGCDPQTAAPVVDDAERHPLGKADTIGSCIAEDGNLLCGGPSDRACWCDELCHQYGDCCADKVDVCDEAPEPDSTCASAADCDDGLCILGTCMAMDDSFVPASVLPYSLRETEGLRPVWTAEDGFSLYLRQAWNGNEDGWILSPGLHGDSWALDEIANPDVVDHLLERPDGTIVPVYLSPGRTAVYAGVGVCSTNGSFRINSYDIAYDDDGDLHVAAITQPRSGGTSRTLRLCSYDGLDSHWTTVRASAAYAARTQLRIDDGGDPEVFVMDGIYVRRYQRTLDTWGEEIMLDPVGTHAVSYQIVEGETYDHVVIGTRSFGSNPSIGTLHVEYVGIDDEGIVRHEAVADSYAGYIVGVGVGSEDRVYVGYTGSAGPDSKVPVDVARIDALGITTSNLGSYESSPFGTQVSVGVGADDSLLLSWGGYHRPTFVREYVRQ